MVWKSIEAQIQTGVEDATSPETSLRKLRKRYEEVSRIDFFDAPGKREVLARGERPLFHCAE
jgi:hypothetical protein